MYFYYQQARTGKWHAYKSAQKPEQGLDAAGEIHGVRKLSVVLCELPIWKLELLYPCMAEQTEERNNP